VTVPGLLERPLKTVASLLDYLGLATEFSAATVAGGFLELHVSGDLADDCFGLVHPLPVKTIQSALAVRCGP
jgi:dihydroflavonol-4-reductase